MRGTKLKANKIPKTVSIMTRSVSLRHEQGRVEVYTQHSRCTSILVYDAVNVCLATAIKPALVDSRLPPSHEGTSDGSCPAKERIRLRVLVENIQTTS